LIVFCTNFNIIRLIGNKYLNGSKVSQISIKIISLSQFF
jgi:hypothetical protein